MNAANHVTGKVASGDVTIFYRLFGEPGATPILITHGANYYDSADWIEVASAIATDRQVAAYDTRGFGESTWSPSKNYSNDAQMGDMVALLDHLGWQKAIVMGHSMGGGRVILFGSRFPERTAGVIIVDHCPGRGGTNPAERVQSIGNPAPVFATVAEAMESMSRDENVPEGSPARARLDAILNPVAGGLTYPRDPDFSNQVPVGAENATPEIVVTDMWAEMAQIAVPTLIVRGTRSNRYNEENLARVRAEFPQFDLIDVDSGHDVAAGAPQQLIDGVRSFLAQRMDG